jgi:hypothetical protein
MSTTKQKEAAKKNIEKAREVQSARAHGAKIPRQTRGLSTADEDKLKDSAFAFPKERKEPLTDAKHVRNAIARFDQVEGISDTEKDAAWKRILKAAKQYNVDVSESSWRELGNGKKAKTSKTTRTSTGAKTSTASKAAKPSTASKAAAGSKAAKASTGSKTSAVSKTSAGSKTTKASTAKPAKASKK